MNPSSDEWCTPAWLATLVGRFDLDPCSNPMSHVNSYATCMRGHGVDHRLNSIADDGLSLDWSSFRSVWLNPPYSNVGPWAVKLSEYFGPWCALLKLDPTTRWWATLMRTNPTIAPFRKRIKFEGAQSMSANFPSVLLFSGWRPSAELASHLWIASYQEAA